MQAWFFAFQIINDHNSVISQGDGTFGSDEKETHKLVDEQREIIASRAGVAAGNVIFTAFNKL
ncbi:hypothetical protein F3J34_15300 [Klebsiella sp. Ap-873]|nr:hypothetical protein [Klebsiella sp. Ap-873]